MKKFSVSHVLIVVMLIITLSACAEFDANQSADVVVGHPLELPHEGRAS